MNHDLFISHAQEDKPGLVAPLAVTLRDFGLSVWYDEFSLKVGDSLVASIDRGLSDSRFGLVVLSRAFIRKPWTQYELRSLVTREFGAGKVILPIWHGVTRQDVLAFSPALADRLALNTATLTKLELAVRIIEVARPDLYQSLQRRAQWQALIKSGKPSKIPLKRLRFGPIKHETLPPAVVVRASVVVSTLREAMAPDLESFLDNLRRDLDYMKELQVWEHIAASYLDYTSTRRTVRVSSADILKVLLYLSMGMTDEISPERVPTMTFRDVKRVAESWIRIGRRARMSPATDAV